MKTGLVFMLNITDGNADWTIHEGDPNGPVYTIEQARAAWDAGQVAATSRSFKRLMDLGWDLKALQAEFCAVLRTQKMGDWTDEEILADFREFISKRWRRQAERN